MKPCREFFDVFLEKTVYTLIKVQYVFYNHAGSCPSFRAALSLNSKLDTCTAALQLFEKGLFSLEDKLSDYMPEFKEMTVKTDDGRLFL